MIDVKTREVEDCISNKSEISNKEKQTDTKVNCKPIKKLSICFNDIHNDIIKNYSTKSFFSKEKINKDALKLEFYSKINSKKNERKEKIEKRIEKTNIEYSTKFFNMNNDKNQASILDMKHKRIHEEPNKLKILDSSNDSINIDKDNSDYEFCDNFKLAEINYIMSNIKASNIESKQSKNNVLKYSNMNRKRDVKIIYEIKDHNEVKEVVKKNNENDGIKDKDIRDNKEESKQIVNSKQSRTNLNRELSRKREDFQKLVPKSYYEKFHVYPESLKIKIFNFIKLKQCNKEFYDKNKKFIEMIERNEQNSQKDYESWVDNELGIKKKVSWLNFFSKLLDRSKYDINNYFPEIENSNNNNNNIDLNKNDNSSSSIYNNPILKFNINSIKSNLKSEVSRSLSNKKFNFNTEENDKNENENDRITVKFKDTIKKIVVSNEDIKKNNNFIKFNEVHLRTSKILSSKYFNTKDQNNNQRKILKYEGTKRTVNIINFVNNFKNAILFQGFKLNKQAKNFNANSVDKILKKKKTKINLMREFFSLSNSKETHISPTKNKRRTVLLDKFSPLNKNRRSNSVIDNKNIHLNMNLNKEAFKENLNIAINNNVLSPKKFNFNLQKISESESNEYNEMSNLENSKLMEISKQIINDKTNPKNVDYKENNKLVSNKIRILNNINRVNKKLKGNINLSDAKTRFASYDFNINEKNDNSIRTIKEGLNSCRSNKSNNFNANLNGNNNSNNFNNFNNINTIKELAMNKKNSILNILNTYKLKRESKVFMANFRFHNNNNNKNKEIAKLADNGNKNKDKKYADFLNKIKEKANKRYKILESGSLKDEADLPLANIKKISNDLKDISEKKLKNIFQTEDDINDLDSLKFDVFSFEKITNRMKKIIMSNSNCKVFNII